MPKVVLFDIDDTLMNSGKAGYEALNRTLEDMTGIPDGFETIDCAGKTDPSIIKEAMQTWGLSTENGALEEFIEEYLKRLAFYMTLGRGHVKPGIYELLNRLAEDEQIHLGLLTGNIQRGARLKLEPFSMNSFFPFGAFGDDEEDRNLLLPIAKNRFTEMSGIETVYSDCIIIGDTPRDVTCARKYDAPCIAVATGRYSIDDLTATAANLVVSDLGDTDEIYQWIRSVN
jgi:phosphoglycolate phosphatase